MASATTNELSTKKQREWSFATQAATVLNPSAAMKDQHGSSSVPIYQTATFKGPPGAPFDYTRSGNPTRSFLEAHLAKLSKANSAHVVSSGMTALDMILRLVKPGDGIIAGDDIYGGSNRLLGLVGGTGRPNEGGSNPVYHLDTTTPSALIPTLTSGKKIGMVLLESPTNPLLKIAPIRELVKVIREHAPDAIIVMDNTMMSPYLCKPSDLGCDITYDSATKYLCGHHDLMAGVITTTSPVLSQRIAWLINAIGTGLDPQNCFLLLRGLKTLPLRMDRQQASCGSIALYLETLGFKVNYPGLKSNAGYDLHKSQAKGCGAVLSFITGDTGMSEKIVEGTEIWGISVSFGSVNSLISMPCLMSHSSIPAHIRAERGMPEDLIRLCVGIEDVHDLIYDLETSLVASGIITAKAAVDENDDTEPGWEVRRAQCFERTSSKPAAGNDKGEILVSAPGKVILFGEHAVVHGVTGIAASVDLRFYAHLQSTSNNPPVLQLNLPDLNLSVSWLSASLPWNLATKWDSLLPPLALDPQLLAALESLCDKVSANASAKMASVAFLYLNMVLFAGRDLPSFVYTARSELPMGAGLGSSAAFSACLTSSVLRHLDLIPSAPTLSPEVIDIVDLWSFLVEKVTHGTPSGIDNAVSVRGGAVVFRKAIPGVQEGGMEGVKRFSSIKFLITDSRVPRDTKSLVAGVTARRVAEPEVIDPLLTLIQKVSDDAKANLSDVTIPRSQFISTLEALIDQNHTYLRALGVSHPSLETIVQKTAEAPFNLHTKLTGAGGGGCAVTLLPDEFDTSSLEAVRANLNEEKFVTYITSVGGPGLGILHNFTTDDDNRASVLKSLTIPEIAAWAHKQGSWAFS